MAREILSSEEDILLPTTESDIWSFAMTVLETVTGEQPYPQIKHDTLVIMLIYNGKLPDQPEILRECSDIWSLLRRCWGDPQGRAQAFAELRARLLLYHETESVDSLSDHSCKEGFSLGRCPAYISPTSWWPLPLLWELLPSISTMRSIFMRSQKGTQEKTESQ